MKQLKNNLNEITYADFVEQIDDFKDNYIPKMLNDFEEKGYLIDVCAYVLAATVRSLLDVANDDALREECIREIKGETKNIPSTSSNIPDAPDIIRETESIK